jgi:hypothetical protein
VSPLPNWLNTPQLRHSTLDGDYLPVGLSGVDEVLKPKAEND